MELFIVRHGETDFNRKNIVQGSGVDSDLNPTGQAQAMALFQHYSHLEFDFIVTSKLKRTHQTVAPFLQNGINWLQNADINEISWGEQEGKISTPQTRELYRQVTTAWAQGRYEVGFPKGENALQLAHRVNRFLDWLKTRPADKLLICTHGRTLRCMTTLMQERPLSDMQAPSDSLGNTCVFHLRLNEKKRFEFLKENCSLHLDKPIHGQTYQQHQ